MVWLMLLRPSRPVSVFSSIPSFSKTPDELTAAGDSGPVTPVSSSRKSTGMDLQRSRRQRQMKFASSVSHFISEYSHHHNSVRVILHSATGGRPGGDNKQHLSSDQSHSDVTNPENTFIRTTDLMTTDAKRLASIRQLSTAQDSKE